MEKKFNLTLSLLCFWVKGEIEIDSRFVKVDMCNTIFDIIPAGRDVESIPLKNISSSRISSSYNIKVIIIGIILVYLGSTTFLSSPIGGFLIVLVGLSLMASGIQTMLVIQRAGNNYFIQVPFFEREKLVKIQKDIEEALALDIDKTDLNQFFDKK